MHVFYKTLGKVIIYVTFHLHIYVAEKKCHVFFIHSVFRSAGPCL